MQKSSIESVTGLLRQAPILKDLSEEEMARLAASSTKKVFRKGEFIAHYGEIWPHILIIESGEISVLKMSRDGRNLGNLRLEAGEVFWSPSFFDGGPLPASLEVKDDCTVYLWQRDAVLRVIRKDCDLLWKVCLMLVGRIRQASEFVEDLAFQPVAGRLARLLLTQSEEVGNTRFARDLTLDEMSAMVGTTPVMVCKVLSRFAADGLIKVSRTELELINRSGLDEVVNIP